MSSPRLEIDLGKIYHNAKTLVQRLSPLGISVTGITKSSLGSPEIANILIQAGVAGLGDSRIENIEALRLAGIHAPITLVRSPMMSQAKRIVASVDISFNTELDVISQLSDEAHQAGRTHGIILMVELGDLREGILPAHLEQTVRRTLQFPNIQLKGIGTNLACRNGVSPDCYNMAELSALANVMDATFGLTLGIISGGNSGNLDWVTHAKTTGRINNLRLGEAIMLGLEPLHRNPIAGLHTDAITLIAEVIEAKVKPSLPWGTIAQSSFGVKPPEEDCGEILQALLAIGKQDVDPCGLEAPAGLKILGASGDHLIVDATQYPVGVGDEMAFRLNYSALLMSMTSPFVDKVFNNDRKQTQGYPSGMI
jgi:ornithine racemase